MACEARCLSKAYDLRSISIGTSPTVIAYRWIKFVGQLFRGRLRQTKAQKTKTRWRKVNDTIGV